MMPVNPENDLVARILVVRDINTSPLGLEDELREKFGALVEVASDISAGTRLLETKSYDGLVISSKPQIVNVGEEPHELYVNGDELLSPECAVLRLIPYLRKTPNNKTPVIVLGQEIKKRGIYPTHVSFYIADDKIFEGPKGLNKIAWEINTIVESKKRYLINLGNKVKNT